jgi:hypothetical protein
MALSSSSEIKIVDDIPIITRPYDTIIPYSFFNFICDFACEPYAKYLNRDALFDIHYDDLKKFIEEFNETINYLSPWNFLANDLHGTYYLIGSYLNENVNSIFLIKTKINKLLNKIFSHEIKFVPNMNLLKLYIKDINEYVLKVENENYVCDQSPFFLNKYYKQKLSFFIVDFDKNNEQIYFPLDVDFFLKK